MSSVSSPRTAKPTFPALRRTSGRITEYLITLTVLIVVNFIAVHALPGDPLDLLFGGSLTHGLDAETRSRLLQGYGLDGTTADQFVRYGLHLLQGDLGYSTQHGKPVIDIIGSVLPWTGGLVVTSACIALGCGVLFGIEAAMHRGKRQDAWFFVVVSIVDSIPPFAKAILLLGVFSLGLEWLPASGAVSAFSDQTGWAHVMDILLHAIGPVAALVLHHLFKMSFFARASVVTILHRPFMTVARAKGVSPGRLRRAYLARNALIVVIARTLTMLTELLAGSVFVETVFAYPGLGYLLFESIYSRDYPLIQGCLLVLGMTILTLNLIADLLIFHLAQRG